MRTIVPLRPDLTLTSSIRRSIRKTPRPLVRSTSGADGGSDLAIREAAAAVPYLDRGLALRHARGDADGVIGGLGVADGVDERLIRREHDVVDHGLVQGLLGQIGAKGAAHPGGRCRPRWIGRLQPGTSAGS